MDAAAALQVAWKRDVAASEAAKMEKRGSKMGAALRSPSTSEADSAWVEKARIAVKVRARLKGKMSMDDFVAPEQLLQLEQIFKEHPGQELDEDEFIRAFGSVMGDNLGPEDLRIWFMRVDANANGSVDWDEFSSHLLYQHHGTLDNPRSREFVQGTLQSEPRVKRHHKQSATRVRVNERTGAYWTVSVDGIVKVWSPTTLKQTHTINNNASLVNARPNAVVMATDLCFGNGGMNAYVSSVDKTINVYNSRYQHIRRYIGRKMVNELKGATGIIGDDKPKVGGNANPVATEGMAVPDPLSRGGFAQKAETTALLQMEDPANVITTVSVNDKEFLLAGLSSGQLYAYHIGRQITPSLVPSQKVNAHTGSITGVMHIPNLPGLTVVTGSWDKTLRLIDLESNSVLETVGPGHNKHAVCCIDWNHDAKLLVSSGPEREIMLWNPFISTPLATLSGHLTNVVGVVFNPVDHQIISMSTDKCVKIWDLRTLKLFQSFIDETDAASPVDKGYTALTFDTKLHRVVAAGSRVQAWPIRRSIQKFTADYKGHTEALVAILYTECFGQVVTVDHGGCVQVWNTSTGEREFLFSFLGNTRRVQDFSERPHPTCACFDAHQRRIFIGDSRGVLRAFNYSNGQETKTIRINESTAISNVLHYSNVDSGLSVATGYRYIVASLGEELYVASDGEDKEERKQYCLHCSHGQITSLSYNPTLKTPLVLVGTQDGFVVMFNIFLATEVAVFSKQAAMPPPITPKTRSPTFITAPNAGSINASPKLRQQHRNQTGHRGSPAPAAAVPRKTHQHHHDPTTSGGLPSRESCPTSPTSEGGDPAEGSDPPASPGETGEGQPGILPPVPSGGAVGVQPEAGPERGAQPDHAVSDAQVSPTTNALLSPTRMHDHNNVYWSTGYASSSGSDTTDDCAFSQLLSSLPSPSGDAAPQASGATPPPAPPKGVSSQKGVESMVWLHQKGVVATVSGSTRIDFWSIRTQQLMFTYKAGIHKVSCFSVIAANPAGDVLVACDDTGVVCVYDISTVIAPPRDGDTTRNRRSCVASRETYGECLQRAVFRAHPGGIVSACLAGFPSSTINTAGSAGGKPCDSEQPSSAQMAGGEVNSPPPAAPPAWMSGYITTCSVDLLVALHTLDGRLVGHFGKRLWSLSTPSTWLTGLTTAYPAPTERAPSQPRGAVGAASGTPQTPPLKRKPDSVVQRSSSPPAGHQSLSGPPQAGVSDQASATASAAGAPPEHPSGANGQSGEGRRVNFGAPPGGGTQPKAALGAVLHAAAEAVGWQGVTEAPFQSITLRPSPESQREAAAAALRSLRAAQRGGKEGPRWQRFPFLRGSGGPADPLGDDGAEMSHLSQPGAGIAPPPSPNVFSSSGKAACRLAPLRVTPQAGLVKFTDPSMSLSGNGGGGVAVGGPPVCPAGDAAKLQLGQQVADPQDSSAGVVLVGGGGVEGGGGGGGGGGANDIPPSPEDCHVAPEGNDLSAEVFAVFPEGGGGGGGGDMGVGCVDARQLSDVNRAIQQQRQIHPKDWVTRAVGLLPLKGKPGFHEVSHPANSWSPAIQTISQRKSRKTEGRR